MAEDKQKYSSLQVNSTIKNQIADYCDSKGLKIGKFVEKLFANFMSSSISDGK